MVKDWWTCGGQTASRSSCMRHARVKTGGPVVFRQLLAHHGGSVHGQRLVDLWWSDSLLIMEAACTGKDWWTCDIQLASCSSYRRCARAMPSGLVVVRQLVAHHGGGVQGQRLVDVW